MRVATQEDKYNLDDLLWTLGHMECVHKCAAHLPFAGADLTRRGLVEEGFHAFGQYLGCCHCKTLMLLKIKKERRWERMSYEERMKWDLDYQNGLVKP